MQRQIKFRAWDKEDKRWLPAEKLNLYSQNFIIELEAMSPGVDIMQFTGLLDKNGKEIYEGDVLEWTDSTKERGIVEWWAGDVCWGVEESEMSEGKPSLGGFDTDPILNGLDSLRCRGYSVIGNIYEDPELIK